jgi:hypothetical protein
MKPLILTRREQLALAYFAAFGFLVPNAVFIYYFLTNPELTRAALSNPISLVFVIEAFFLMFLFAWLLRRLGVRKPGALGFVVMSLLGSMAFSVPATLVLLLRGKTISVENR